MKHFTLWCQEKQNKIAALIHPFSVDEVFEGDQQWRAGTVTVSWIGCNESFLPAHTSQVRRHRSDGGSHQWNEWRVTQEHLHCQNLPPHLLSLHLRLECRQHMQCVTSDFISSFINSLACARHQQVQENHHGSAAVESQRTRKGKDSALEMTANDYANERASKDFFVRLLYVLALKRQNY